MNANVVLLFDLAKIFSSHRKSNPSKAIEHQGKKQLDAIKNIETDSKSSKIISFFSGLKIFLEAKKLLNELKKKKNILET